jgi:hypothetical protein
LLPHRMWMNWQLWTMPVAGAVRHGYRHALRRRAKVDLS